MAAAAAAGRRAGCAPRRAPGDRARHPGATPRGERRVALTPSPSPNPNPNPDLHHNPDLNPDLNPNPNLEQVSTEYPNQEAIDQKLQLAQKQREGVSLRRQELALRQAAEI